MDLILCRVENIEKVRELRLQAIKDKKERQMRRRNEKEEREKMKMEDYDVTDILAGFVNVIESEEAEEEESEVYLDDESFFEPYPDEMNKTKEFSHSKLSTSNNPQHLKAQSSANESTSRVAS